MDSLAILVYALTFLLVPRLGTAHPVTSIVDDTDANISYSPSDGWNQGEDCSICTIRPDPSQAHGETWRDITSSADVATPHSFDFQFTGTGIAVFNIICNQQVNGQPTATNLQFFLDGQEDGNNFLHSPDPNGAPFVYNVGVYSHSGLQNGVHTLRVQAIPGMDSLILFDYLQVTKEVADPPPPPPIITSTSSTSSSTTISSSSITSSSGASSSTISLTASSTISLTASTTISDLPQRTQTSSSSGLSSITSSPTGPNASNTSPFTSSSTPSSSGSQAFASSQTEPFTSPTAASPAAAIPVGLVAGATAGGVGTLIFLVISVILLRNRTRNSSVSHLRKEKSGYSDSLSFGNDHDGDRHIPSMPSFPSSASESVLLIGHGDQSRMSHTTGQSHLCTSPGLSYIHSSDSDSMNPRVVSIAADTGIWQYQYQDPVDLETAAPSSAFFPRSPRQSMTGMQMHDMHGSPVPPPPVPAFAPASSDPSRPLPRVPPREAESNEPLIGSRDTSGAGQPGLAEPASGLIAALQEEIVRLREQNMSTPPPRYDQPPTDPEERALEEEPELEHAQEKMGAHAQTQMQEKQNAQAA